MQKHAVRFDEYQGMLFKDKIAELKRSPLPQPILKKKLQLQQALLQKLHYVVPNLIAVKSKPFTDGEFIMQSLESVADTIFPDKKQLFLKSVCLTRP